MPIPIVQIIKQRVDQFAADRDFSAGDLIVSQYHVTVRLEP